MDASTRYAAIKDELCTVGKCVLRGNGIVIPNKLRSRVVALAHEGHLGVVGTKQTIRTKVWWPGLAKDVEKHVRACYGCQVTSRPSPPEPLRRYRVTIGTMGGCCSRFPRAAPKWRFNFGLLQQIL